MPEADTVSDTKVRPACPARFMGHEASLPWKDRFPWPTGQDIRISRLVSRVRDSVTTLAACDSTPAGAGLRREPASLAPAPPPGTGASRRGAWIGKHFGGFSPRRPEAGWPAGPACPVTGLGFVGRFPTRDPTCSVTDPASACLAVSRSVHQSRLACARTCRLTYNFRKRLFPEFVTTSG